MGITKTELKVMVVALTIQIIGLAASWATVEWLIPKNASGHIERPLDVFYVVIILGATGGAAIGLFISVALGLCKTDEA
jgi:hypothetical protein